MRPSYLIYPGLKLHLLTNKQLHSIRGKNNDQKALSIILLEVCNHFNLEPSKVRGRSRIRERVWARQLYCYLSRKFTNLPLTEIGKLLDGRDHTTVIYSADTVKDVIEKHLDLAGDAKVLESMVSDKLFIEHKTIKDFTNEP